jgi:alanyl-tRNA synthetase
VAPDRLRFDFTHFKPVSAEEVASIEEQVNRAIRANIIKSTAITTYQEALAAGAMALFGEKYGDRVRMVCLGDYSCELCGGTHVERTGDIGFFLVSSEESVGSGVRRIEALTGTAADRTVRGRLSVLDRVGQRLGGDVETRVQGLLDELGAERRTIQQLQRQLARQEVDRLIESKVRIGDVWVIAAKVGAPNPEALREMGDVIRARLTPSVVALGTASDSRASVVVMVGGNAGVNARDVISRIAPIFGGKGGGRPDVAQAGGTRPENLTDALDEVAPFIAKHFGVTVPS